MYWMTLPASSTTSSNPKGNQSEGQVNQSSQWHFSPLTDQWAVPYLCQLSKWKILCTSGTQVFLLNMN